MGSVAWGEILPLSLHNFMTLTKSPTIPDSILESDNAYILYYYKN